jgi:Cu(I)/Ag(I) efflux system membrane fusion protein
MSVLLAILFSACNKAEENRQHIKEHEQHPTVYTCPLHPEVLSPDQGICQKCKMKLELKVDDASYQIAAPNKQVLSRQSTLKISSPNGPQMIKRQGYIDIDRTRNQSVSIRFGGRIEKLFVKYELQYVKKGDKILELYSPELNTFQEEHLFLLHSGKEKSLLEQSRQKLKLLGITDNQISALEKKGTLTKTISIYSPSDGYVLFNSELKNYSETSNQAPMNSMNGKSNVSKKFNSSNSQIREGIYVNKGETLFNVNDLQNVWAIVSISSEFQASLQSNHQVKITSELFPDKPLSGKIALIEQTFEDDKQRFVRVRINLPNPKGELKLNSLVTAEFPQTANRPENFRSQIPVSAVYRTGLNSFVWVKIGTTKDGAGIFRLRKVTTGIVTNGNTTIISGLSANEEVAEHTGFLTDNETFLNEN